MPEILAILLVLIGTVFAAFGSLYLKKGAEKFNFNIFKQLKNKNLILGIAAFVAGSLFYLYALSMEDLSLLYPITALTYVWVAFISTRFLSEKMNLLKWAGIVLIIIGIFFITYFS